MALTISYEGTGVLAQAGGASYPNDGSGGSWSNTGGGTSAGYNPDAFVQGTESVGLKYAGKDGIAYYTHTSSLNFTTGGAQEGEYIYIWVNILSNGQFDTITANPPGLSIILGSGTNAYRRWTIAGDSNDNGWGSGWKCFVIDPNSAGTSDNGNYNANNISLIGLDINSDTSVRADSIFIDEITCASGIRVTGTTTAGDAWGEIITWAKDTPGSRRLGFVDEREGVIYCKGRLYIGNSSATTVFQDSGKIVKFETTEYYNGSAWVTSIPNTFCGITLEDGSGTTTFQDGILVGSNNGRSGSTYIGNENELVDFDLTGLSNSSSVVNLYGTTFRSMYGVISFITTASSYIYGANFIDCGKIICSPGDTAEFRNCNFVETASNEAAVQRRGTAAQLQLCSFIANTTGAAIEVIENVNQTFTSLTFSGNTNDVYLNNGGSSISISNASGSNASSYTSATAGTVTFTVSATLTINNLRANSEVRIIRQSDLAELGGIENAIQTDPINSGRYQFQYAYTTAIPIYVVVGSNNYQFQRISYSLGGVDETLLVSQVLDRQYDSGSV